MIGRILALALGLFCGLAASQGPEFAQQYRQRLGGAIDELRRVVTRFDASAAQSGLDRSAAIARLAAQDEPLARREADAMTANADRLDHLERQRDAAAAAGPFARLAVLAHGIDAPLAEATYRDFEPAWPATEEGLVLGGGGFLLGWLGLRSLFGTLGRIRRRRPDDLRTA